MIKKHQTVVLAVLALLAIGGTAGCDSSDETAAASLTKAQYAKKADLICADAGEEQFKNAGAYLSKHPEAKEIELVEPAGISPLEKEIRALAALSPPEGKEDDVQAFMDEFRVALRKLKEEPETALSTQDNPFVRANKLARQLGLGDCSRNP